MADITKIEWCDSTFNPWTGCTKVSPACDHCYAESWSKRAGERVGKWGPGAARVRTSPHLWREPLRWEKYHHTFEAAHGRRRRVFCASLADVFDNEVDPAWRADLFGLILATPHLDWLLLTKRIGNVVPMLRGLAHGSDQDLTVLEMMPIPNVWIGATVATQEEADRDIPKLLQVPARVRFLSIEPMLSPINLGEALWQCCERWEYQDYGCYGHRPECCSSHVERDLLHWVIAGGESGPHARPMHPAWVRSLRDQCEAAGVPFLFKQWGEWAPYDRGRTDGSLLATLNSLDTPLQRQGKKLAGRLLDGVEHNGFPQA